MVRLCDGWAAARCWEALDAGRTVVVVQVDRAVSERGYLDLAVHQHLRGARVAVASTATWLDISEVRRRHLAIRLTLIQILLGSVLMTEG